MSHITLQSPPCFSTDTSSVHFTTLNNATNNYSNTISTQPLPRHGAHFPSGVQLLGDVGQNATENVPPSENATVSSGSKRKADLDENCSGLNLQKAWVLPISQEPSQIPFAIPPQLQEPQAWAQQPQGGSNGTNAIIQGVYLDGFYIPPEIVGINVDLNGLRSCIPIPCSPPLLTTTVAREDTDIVENRFYPYLWFPGSLPSLLQEREYQSILSLELAGALQKAFQMLGMEYKHGTLALTARRQPVVFFEVQEMEAMKKQAMKKQTESSPRWQDVMKQNKLVAFMEHYLEQGGSGSNALQSNIGAFVQHTESNPSFHNDQQMQVTIPTAQRRTHKRPAQNSNGPSPAVFMETYTRESFPHPQNTSAAARSGSKRRPRVRASANSRALRKDATSIEELKMAKKQKIQRGKRHITKDTEPSEIQAGPSGTRDSEPEVPEIEPVYSFSQQVSGNILYQLASSQTPAPLATDQVDLVNFAAAHLAHSTQLVAPFTDESQNAPIYQYVRFDGQQQAVNQDPLGQGNLFELDFATSGGYNWQPQPSDVGFDPNNPTRNLTNQEFFNLLNSVERSLQYDTVEEVFYVQARGSTSGFLGSLAGDFTGLPS